MDPHHRRKSLMLKGRENVRKLELYKARRRAIARLRMEKIRAKLHPEKEEYILVRRKV